MFCCTNPDSEQCDLDYKAKLAETQDGGDAGSESESGFDAQVRTYLQIAAVVAVILCFIISALLVLGLFYQTKKRKQKYFDHVKLNNDMQFQEIKGKIVASDEGLHDLEKMESGNNSKRSIVESDSSPEENASLSSYKSNSIDIDDAENKKTGKADENLIVSNVIYPIGPTEGN